MVLDGYAPERMSPALVERPRPRLMYEPGPRRGPLHIRKGHRGGWGNRLALVPAMFHTSPRKEESKVDQEKPRERLSRFIRESLVPDWRPSRDQWLWALRIVLALAALLGILTLIGSPFDITLWNWLDLLIIPAVLAIGGYLFTRSENRATQVAAEQRAQDEALQAYLDQMSNMLIPNEGQPSLYKARPGDSLSSVARARTLTVLSRLDDERKARVVQFLYESGLISEERTVLTLAGAALSEARLSGAVLSRADLSEAHLRSADLRSAVLSGADLGGADLRSAVLRSAVLSGADLGGADLGGADLSGADLSEADLRWADLRWADLRSAVLSGADLSGADLRWADLGGAVLSSRAVLSGAELSGADLSGAVLGRTTSELEQQAFSLGEATMPDGKKYEDWLKDKKGSEKNGDQE